MGIVELSSKNASLHCYPNPASNQLTIDLSELNGEEVGLKIYNSMGLEVRSYAGIRMAQLTLTRGDLPNGLYLIDVLVKGKRYVSRIVFN
jgi:hypothetical protein